MQQSPILESTLTCPVCGFASVEHMPTDACVFFHECVGCHARLRAKPGDCCVLYVLLLRFREVSVNAGAGAMLRRQPMKLIR